MEKNVAYNASISDELQTSNTDHVQPNESDDPWTNLKLYLISNCPSVAGFHDVAADQVYVKKSSSHDVKTDMTAAYAAAMDPGGKFIMVTPSKIAMILFIVKTKEFRTCFMCCFPVLSIRCQQLSISIYKSCY